MCAGCLRPLGIGEKNSCECSFERARSNTAERRNAFGAQTSGERILNSAMCLHALASAHARHLAVSALEAGQLRQRRRDSVESGANAAAETTADDE